MPLYIASFPMVKRTETNFFRKIAFQEKIPYKPRDDGDFQECVVHVASANYDSRPSAMLGCFDNVTIKMGDREKLAGIIDEYSKLSKSKGEAIEIVEIDDNMLANP